MPMIRVQLSPRLADDARAALMKRLSATVAASLGKPESYMMVVLEAGVPMLMAGKPDPAALVEVRSVGTISGGAANDLSGKLSALLAEAGVPADRVYCNFMGVPGAMWGHGDSTFG